MKAVARRLFLSQNSEVVGKPSPKKSLRPRRLGLNAAVLAATTLAGLVGLSACGPAGTTAATGGSANGGQVASGGGATSGGQSTSSGGNTASVGGGSVGGGSVGGGSVGGGSNAGELPADATQASIEAFLAAESYKPWTHDATPRAPIGTTNPHLLGDPGVKLQVYFNSTATASIAKNAGKDLLMVNHTIGSMVVKEMFDSSGQRVGRGTSMKTGADRRAFTFYCEGPVDACGVKEPPPIYGSTNSLCSGCHGGSIFAPVPSP